MKKILLVSSLILLVIAIVSFYTLKKVKEEALLFHQQSREMANYLKGFAENALQQRQDQYSQIKLKNFQRKVASLEGMLDVCDKNLAEGRIGCVEKNGEYTVNLLEERKELKHELYIAEAGDELLPSE